MTASHLLRQVRETHGLHLVTCSCGHVSKHRSRPVSMAFHIEHCVGEYQKPSVYGSLRERAS